MVVLWFVAALLIRTLQFKPVPVRPVEAETVSLDKDKIVTNMAEI